MKVIDDMPVNDAIALYYEKHNAMQLRNNPHREHPITLIVNGK